MKNIQYGKYDLDHNGQLTEDELITAQNLSDRTPEEEKEMNSYGFDISVAHGLSNMVYIIWAMRYSHKMRIIKNPEK